MLSKEIIIEAVKRIQRKDKLAMNLLYNSFVSEMITLSYRITDDLGTSEDIIQDSFLTSFQKIDQLQKPENYKSWLKRIVVVNSLKRKKKKISYELIPEHALLIEESTPPRWYEEIKFEVINKVIQELPQGCREILTLHLLDNYKHKDIAELLKISISTSKSQYRYGLKLLRTRLKKELK